MTMTQERWKQIVRTDGAYSVSDFGRVRNNQTGRILKPEVKPSGHLRVRLHGFERDYVHRLVLTTFVCEAAAGEEGLHGNGKPADCRLTNLRWGTRGENTMDRKYHTPAKSAKLTATQARELKSLIGSLKGVDLAKRFNVCQSTVTAIKQGRFHADC